MSTAPESPPAPSRRTALLRWLRDTPVTTKLAAMAVGFVIVVTVLIGVAVFAMDVTAGLRGYVRGEGLWSRGQKDAVYYLSLYTHSGSADHYARYQKSVALPLGDHQARIELQRPDFDYDIAMRGFMQGANDAEDIPGMISLFRRFHDLYYLAEAIRIWTEADGYIVELERCAQELHAATKAGRLNAAMRDGYLGRIEAINTRLTPLEHQFSSTLGEGSRYIHGVLLKAILIGSVLLLAAALGLSRSISQELLRSVMNLRDGALRVAAGDLDHRIPVRSRDELGDLTQVFNDMIANRQGAESDMEIRNEELARSNAELERFAYVASHDLQEPLRTLTSFTQLLLKRFAGKGDAETEEFSGYILEAAQRMRELIEGLLSYSRVSTEREQLQPVDLNTLLERATANLAGAIQESGAVINSEPLPTLPVRQQLLVQLFQNLVGNALKFRGTAAPVVQVKAWREKQEWIVEVRDNGIGVDPKHAERIFLLFQRLHTRDRYPGSGLGLAICKKIVERHGGRIWLEPSAAGAAFRFTLPVS